MTEHVKSMYDFHTWANQTLLNRLRELPEEVYTQEVQSVFPTVAKVMNHIYMVDQSWLTIMSGVDMREVMSGAGELEKQLETKNVVELQAMYRELAERFTAFFNQESDLERKLVLDNPYTSIRDTSLAEMVLQVVNHGTYHRGNVTAMLRQMGHASVMTEYAAYWYWG
ncbi:DinB family protein [Brevibacillus sp. SIMBA_040]|uniref:DinB family protein n=1 Tax=unclassified Brevibacillus TaxID=2684853 RepID=UPI00397A7A6D